MELLGALIGLEDRAAVRAYEIIRSRQGRVVLEGPSAEVAASKHVQRAYLGVG